MLLLIKYIQNITKITLKIYKFQMKIIVLVGSIMFICNNSIKRKRRLNYFNIVKKKKLGKVIQSTNHIIQVLLRILGLNFLV